MDITRTSKEEIHSIEGRDLFKDTEGPRDSMGNEDGYTHKPTHVPDGKGKPWPKASYKT